MLPEFWSIAPVHALTIVHAYAHGRPNLKTFGQLHHLTQRHRVCSAFSSMKCWSLGQHSARQCVMARDATG